jgi:hypothetical protein
MVNMVGGGVVRGALCAGAMLVTCDGVWGMMEDSERVEEIRELPLTCDFGNTLFKEYANCGFCIWEKDGLRFLSQSFLDTYRTTGVAPILEDGRPNIRLWLDCTLYGNFFAGWGTNRFEFAEPFLRNMLLTYSTLGIGKDGGKFDNLSRIERILEGLVESYVF